MEDLNTLRGRGLGSRMMVSASDLPEGWRYERKSDKYCVWFDDKGRQYKSSKKVEAALREQGYLTASENETETETEPETSEYELSPVKKPRIGPR